MLKKTQKIFLSILSLVFVGSSSYADSTLGAADHFNCGSQCIAGTYSAYVNDFGFITLDEFTFSKDGTAAWTRTQDAENIIIPFYSTGLGEWKRTHHRVIATFLSTIRDTAEEPPYFLRLTLEIEQIDRCTLKVVRSALRVFDRTEDPRCGTPKDTIPNWFQQELKRVSPRTSDLDVAGESQSDGEA